LPWGLPNRVETLIDWGVEVIVGLPVREII
jgi:hypothetical protein